jgi:hypothetical protein
MRLELGGSAKDLDAPFFECIAIVCCTSLDAGPLVGPTRLA